MLSMSSPDDTLTQSSPANIALDEHLCQMTDIQQTSRQRSQQDDQRPCGHVGIASCLATRDRASGSQAALSGTHGREHPGMERLTHWRRQTNTSIRRTTHGWRPREHALRPPRVDASPLTHDKRGPWKQVAHHTSSLSPAALWQRTTAHYPDRPCRLAEPFQRQLQFGGSAGRQFDTISPG